ncbi:MAG: DNA repair protein RadA [Clostridiales bacterium]|nr:DNA repair protein RadA [Clostridiales bacterium]
MAKNKTLFVCGACGYETSGWMGRCPSCKAWNTLVEERIDSAGDRSAKPSMRSNWVGDSGVRSLAEVSSDTQARFSSGIGEFDRILGGGFVEGALVLVGGDPGIGKSTLLLQICNRCEREGHVLYVSGEESQEQIRMRASRLGISSSSIMLCSHTSFEDISRIIEKDKPSLCVIDSIQTLYSEELTSAPGSVSQAREVTAGLLQIAKNLKIPIVLVGHVTKDGSLAGPRVLEHMVDTVIYFEGEGTGPFRMIRAVKNRFGATGELAFFEMTDQGLKEIDNASSILLAGRPINAPGSVITSMIEGSRSVFVEIQALLSPTSFSVPQRMAQGLDRMRLGMLLAILEKKFTLGLNNMDAYVNVIGGLKINERSADLAVLAAIFSAFRDIPVRSDTLVLGEVGLTGEIRPVNFIERRLGESIALGFRNCVLPGANKQAIDKLSKKITSNTRANTADRAIIALPDFIFVDSLSEAIDVLFASDR